MTANTCPWCKTENDATSVPVGKHGVLFHDACRKAGDQAVRIAAQAQDARRLAEQEQTERDRRIRRHRPRQNGSPEVPQ